MEHVTFRQKSIGFCTPKHGTSQPVLPYLQNWRLSIQFWLLKFCCYDPMSTLARTVPVNQIERIVSVHFWSFFFGGFKLVRFFKYYKTKFDQNNQFLFPGVFLCLSSQKCWSSVLTPFPRFYFKFVYILGILMPPEVAKFASAI